MPPHQPEAPPRVSVVIPVYNAGHYLEEALESVVAQSYEDWEAVIVDDASSDGSYAVASEYARRHPSKIRTIKLERNLGVAQARNIAIRSSRGGELVALLDQDDLWRADYLEHCVGEFDRAAAADGRPGIVACNALVATPHGVTETTFADMFWWADEIDYDGMIRRNYILARALFSREAYERVGGFAPECLASDDYDLWLRILEAGYEVVVTPEPVAVYRVHPESQSANHRLMAEGILEAYRRALDRGALDRRQRWAVRAQMRHYRALRERARVVEASSLRHLPQAALLTLSAAPLGLVAFLQAPSRWGEWSRRLLSRVPVRGINLRGTWGKIGYTASARAYSLLTAFLILILTARILGPDGRGTLAAVTTWVTLFSTFGYLSLGQVAIFHATKKERREWLATTLGTLLLVAAAMSVLGWLVVGAIFVVTGGSAFTNLSGSALALGFMVLPFMIWEQYGSSLLAAIDRLDIYNRAQLFGRTVGLVLVIIALQTGLGILGVLGALVVMRGLVSGAGIRLLVREARAPVRGDRATLRRLLVGGMKLHVHSIGAFMFTATDVLVVNYFRGPTETGLYQLAVQFVTAMLVAPVAANLVLYGKTTELGADGAWPATRKVLIQMTVAMGAFAAVAALVAPWLLPALVGADFEPSVGVFQLLLCALIGMTFTNVMATQWIARGLFWQISVLYFTIGVFNLGLNLLLVPEYGMQGSAWALLATYAIAVAVNGWLVVKAERSYRENRRIAAVAQPSLG